MKKASLLLAGLAASAVAACSSTRSPAAPSSQTAEPMQASPSPYAFYSGDNRWGGVLLDDRIYLDSPSSAGWYSSAIIAREIPPGGSILRTNDMTVTIEDGGCDKSNLRRNFPDRVIVNWDGGVYYGCGGVRIDRRSVRDTSWQVMEMDGVRAPVARPPAATLNFDANGRIGGTLDCNDGGVGADWSENNIQVFDRRVVQTEIGCADDYNYAFAERFWRSMLDAERWTLSGDELTIYFSTGETAKLRRLL